MLAFERVLKWFCRAKPTTPAETLSRHEKTDFLVVSFFTKGNGYDVAASRLRASLEKFDLKYEIDELPLLPSWEENCARKSQFILDKWLKSSVPIVWLDADATVEQYPELFTTLSTDFAIHRWTWKPREEPVGHEFVSATLYFGKTDNAEKLLRQWCMRSKADPTTWDQVHLHSAWCDISASTVLKTEWLPRKYLQIDWGEILEQPVICQWQASRQDTSRQGKTKSLELTLSTKGKEIRRKGIHWRKPEQAFWIEKGLTHIIELEHIKHKADVLLRIRQLIAEDETLLDFGCGTGRIARKFRAENYLGIDINPHAVANARIANPHHTFRTWDEGLELPQADHLLFSEVLQHIADSEIDDILELPQNIRKSVIIVDVRYPRGSPASATPTFHRTAEDYTRILTKLGFSPYAADTILIGENEGMPAWVTFIQYARRPS